MARGRALRIQNSIHQKFILDCIEKDLKGPEIHKLLLEKGSNISIPTLNKYIKEVKRQGIGVTKFKEKAESTALEINNKLKDIPELTTIFSRRNFLIDNLLERRSKVVDFATEGKRTRNLIILASRAVDLSEKIKAKPNIELINEFQMTVKDLIKYCNNHFLPDEVFPQLEDTIRKYTMDIHELCKYVEQWTSKYEIEALMEKLTEMITRSAVDTFGPLLKKQTDEQRKKYIDKFISEVETAVNSLKDYEIDLSEKK